MLPVYLLQILRRQAALIFAVLCIIIFSFSVFLGAVGLSDPICYSFLTWFGHDFPAGQFVSVRNFLILNFSYCPLSRVLHVTLANWQRFGFEFHLRSSPSAYSEFVNISRPAEYFTACYTVLKRPNKVETAVHGCNLAFSLDSIVSLPR